MGLTEDGWLSERFGHPAFTVPEGDPGPEALVILEHAAKVGTAFYQARVPAERTDWAGALTRAGFEVVNVTVTLVREPGPLEDGGSQVGVRGADPDTDQAVLEIAERGFSKTRFHLDPSIPNVVADRIKRDWAENSLNGGRGDGMLVAVRNGEPVGFLAGLPVELEGGRSAHVIDLIAVDEPARDAGAGGALVSRFVSDAQGDFDEVRVGTQAANPDATRFYERLGFTTAASAFDLHLHVGDERLGE